jgi:hypothetical protein
VEGTLQQAIRKKNKNKSPTPSHTGKTGRQQEKAVGMQKHCIPLPTL